MLELASQGLKFAYFQTDLFYVAVTLSNLRLVTR